MLGLVAKIPIKEGKFDEAVAMFKDLITHVANEEGTLSYTINRDKANPNVVVVMERYKDKAALDVHSSTPHFKEFFGKIGGIMNGKPDIAVMEELLSI